VHSCFGSVTPFFAVLAVGGLFDGARAFGMALQDEYQRGAPVLTMIDTSQREQLLLVSPFPRRHLSESKMVLFPPTSAVVTPTVPQRTSRSRFLHEVHNYFLAMGLLLVTTLLVTQVLK
jgi:hypothetical protein